MLGPGCISALGALLEQRIRDLAVDMLLLEAVLVVDGNLAIEVLEPRRLAEAQELIVDEAVVHAVELVDIVDDGLALIAENGGRHELRLEPSDKIKPIGSRHSAGMVLEKRAVQIAIDWRNGRNSGERQVGGSIYA